MLALNKKIDKSNSKTNSSSNHEKIDPTIKAATIDHYNRYLIQIIDNDLENRKVLSQEDRNDYIYIQGKIDRNQFTLRVPKAVLEKPNIKLKIVNLKTKTSKTFNADFLSEAVSLPKGGSFRVYIDSEGSGNIRTEVRMPSTGTPPFPNTSLPEDQ
jgi:hypothetical protein